MEEVEYADRLWNSIKIDHIKGEEDKYRFRLNAIYKGILKHEERRLNGYIDLESVKESIDFAILVLEYLYDKNIVLLSRWNAAISKSKKSEAHIWEEIILEMEMIREEKWGRRHRRFKESSTEVESIATTNAEATTSTNEAQRIKELEEEVQRLREATSTAPTTPEDSPEVQTLREENNRLREEVESLKTQMPTEEKKKIDRAGYLSLSTTERAEALQILLSKALGKAIERSDKGAFNLIFSMIAGAKEENTARYIRGCKGDGMMNEPRRKKAEEAIQNLLDEL